MLGTKARKLLPERVGERIFSHIRKRGLWGERLPSQRDLAEQLGVSLETVHKGMRHLREAGVLVSVPRQGTYVVNHPVETLAVSSRAKMLLLVARQQDPRSNLIFRGILGPLDALAVARGLDSVVTALDEGMEQRSFTTTYPPVSGDLLVFLGITHGFERIKRLLRVYRSPAVLLDHFEPTLGIPGVCDDGHTAMHQLVAHLLGQGRRRIAYLDYVNRSNNPWKRDGYQSALKQAGVAPDPALIVPVAAKDEAVAVVVHDLMGRTSAPTAFVAVDDRRGVAAVRALEQLGFRPGTDVSVTGHGDQAFVEGTYAELTSVRIDWTKVGELGVGHLSGERPLPSDRMVTVPGRLVLRASSGARVG